jgi:HD superfamily phosphodiesterase
MAKSNQLHNSFEKVIDQVSKILIPDIIAYLKELYAGKWLPSHDISHHQRVWQNAVEICRQYHLNQPLFGYHFYEELLISCFFHDTGLLIDPSEFHGKKSKFIAERFLISISQKIRYDTTSLLEAIEKHDDKKYESTDINSNKLLEILSLADDIDAFGAIGLYRYIEIYLVRGIEVENIPEQILSNANRRYNNLIFKLEKYNIDKNLYAEKYQVLFNLLAVNTFSESPVSLVNWIKATIVETKKNPFQFLKFTDIISGRGSRIHSFISNFSNEATY